MNAGIIYEDEAVEKTTEKLKQVELQLTQQITPELKDQYKKLRQELADLTGSVAW